MGDVGLAIQRAEDKTEKMQARAGAIDELIASGALDDASSINSGDDITRELESMSSQADVEAELAAAQGQLLRRGPARPSRPRPSRARSPTPSRSSRSRPRLEPNAARTPAMIVRIMGEGQLDVADDALDRPQRARRGLETAIESGDEATFAHRAAPRCSTGPHASGTPLAADTSTRPT